MLSEWIPESNLEALVKCPECREEFWLDFKEYKEVQKFRCEGCQISWDHDENKRSCENHYQDSDCRIYFQEGELEGQCLVCGVEHGLPCPECSQRAFHSEDCSLSDLNN